MAVDVGASSLPEPWVHGGEHDGLGPKPLVAGPRLHDDEEPHPHKRLVLHRSKCHVTLPT
eukprot:2254484-Rhodomonas_salina.1